MADLKVYDDSKNYTCQVIKLPTKVGVNGLDNLVEVNYQGNSCLINKDSPEDQLYLFFPAECKICDTFLSCNDLYRHHEYNQSFIQDGVEKKGFFEDNGRVKSIKFKGIISTGFVIPISSLGCLTNGYTDLKVGDEFNQIDGIEVCEKYRKHRNKLKGMSNPKTRVIDEIVDSRMAPEHPDTGHLLKNLHKIGDKDTLHITYKLHGTSARYYNTLVKRKLSLIERLCKFLGGKVQEEAYDYVTASRRVIKGVGFETLPNKNHYFTSGDLWSEVGKEFFEGKLNEGEAVYCEIIGKTYTGEAIQNGYSYQFEKPMVYVYRIANINHKGIEIDLPYDQMIIRADQLSLKVCPHFFTGTIGELISRYFPSVGRNDANFSDIVDKVFNERLLDKPSILDGSVTEEGFCIRIDKYPKPEIFKIKSKLFLLHEGAQLDKAEVVDIEEEQSVE
jgi:hypothetical protein